MPNEGEAVAQDKAEASRLLRLAAEQGEQDAQYHLGLDLLTSAGGSAEPPGPEQLREGALFLARAAQQTDKRPDICSVALLGLSMHAQRREVVHACCVGCGKSRRLKVCSKCHVAKFCGAACMKRLWPVHRQSCRRWAEEAAQAGALCAAMNDACRGQHPEDALVSTQGAVMEWVLDRLVSHHDCWPFLGPVDNGEAADSYEAVTSTDFAMIRCRASAGYYPTLRHFAADIRTIFTECRANHGGDLVYEECAFRIEAALDQALALVKTHMDGVQGPPSV